MAKNYYALENKDPPTTYPRKDCCTLPSLMTSLLRQNELKKIKLNEAKTNNSVITPKTKTDEKIHHVLSLASAVVMAQRKSKKEKKKDTITPPVITVVTSYTPTIADASKIKKTPVITLSDNSKKKLDYKIFSAPVVLHLCQRVVLLKELM